MKLRHILASTLALAVMSSTASAAPGHAPGPGHAPPEDKA